MIPISYYITLSGLLFVIAIIGIFLNRRNLILILLCVEILVLAVSLNFVAFAAAANDLAGHYYALFVLTVAAAETAIALSIMVVYYRLTVSVQVDKLNQLHG